MMILRSVEESDLEQLLELAGAAGQGMTTLPTSEGALVKRIKWSLESFAAEVSQPGEEYYFLTLEDTKTGRLAGTSAIFASVGTSIPFYNYKLLKLTQVSKKPELKVETELLTLANDYAGATELGTLFLHPDYRGGGNGKLLSRGRYLLIANNPARFAETVMAELRGWVNEEGESPFWNALGKHFFGLSFAEADRINGLGNYQFIADLMPKFPIYTNLLPKEAQEVIGKPHENTAPAKALLEREGFRYRGAVDIFDAGPCLEAARDEIHTVRQCRKFEAHLVDEVMEGEKCLVATRSLENFKVAQITVHQTALAILDISRRVADEMGIREGDTVIRAAERKS